MGYLGGDLGPDLSRIGQIRSERDLLESMVFPSASFVRSYEPVVIETKSGEIHNGVLREDAQDEVMLVTGAESRVRLARTEIAEIRPGTVSVMPSGLDQLLSEARARRSTSLLERDRPTPTLTTQTPPIDSEHQIPMTDDFILAFLG